MDSEIINKVQNSSLITIDLADYAPTKKIMELDLKQFLFDGYILKEKSFRSSLKIFDFNAYENQTIAVFCSTECIVPMWAYMLVTSALMNVTNDVYFGNQNSVFEKILSENIEKINPLEFKNKKVIVKGCSKLKISEKHYVIITKKLKKTVYSLMFGEACSSVPVFKKKIK